MGEIADMMIDGTLDMETGEFIDGESPGYPRRVGDSNKHFLRSNKTCKELNGVAKFLAMKKFDHNEATDIIVKYCKDKLGFEGTLKECAKEIQKDFGSFAKYVKQL